MNKLSENKKQRNQPCKISVIYFSSSENNEKPSDDEKIYIHDKGEWGTWTGCSASCGHGYQTRSKKICLKLPTSKEYDCAHVKIQKKECGGDICPG